MKTNKIIKFGNNDYYQLILSELLMIDKEAMFTILSNNFRSNNNFKTSFLKKLCDFETHFFKKYQTQIYIQWSWVESIIYLKVYCK